MKMSHVGRIQPRQITYGAMDEADKDSDVGHLTVYPLS
jgi:hypothetical protein